MIAVAETTNIDLKLQTSDSWGVIARPDDFSEQQLNEITAIAKF